MRHELETITPILDTRPDVPTELTDRKTSRDKLAAYFRLHPGEMLDQAELSRIAGANAVTQRVRELVRDSGMHIESVPTFLTDAAGKKHRLLNRYRFTDYQPLGRDGSEVVAQAPLFELH